MTKGTARPHIKIEILKILVKSMPHKMDLDDVMEYYEEEDKTTVRRYLKELRKEGKIFSERNLADARRSYHRLEIRHKEVMEMMVAEGIV